MKRSRLILRFICLALMCFFIRPLLVSAADIKYPTRTIKYVVPFAAGGPVDITARKLVDLAGPYLGQEVIVDNKPGAGAVVGARFVIKSKPDGYTIGTFTPSPFVSAPFFMEIDYDPTADFTPIIQYAFVDQPVAVPYDSPIKTFKDFLEEARKRDFTIGGTGQTPGDYSIEYLSAIEKLRIKIVPFGGMSRALPAVLGGQTDAINNSGIYEYVRSKKLRLIFLTTGVRNSEFPDVPTLKELGYDIDVPSFIGVFGPKGLPEQIRKKLEEVFSRAAHDPSFARTVNNVSWTFDYANSEDLEKSLKAAYKRADRDYKKLGIGKYAKGKK